MKHKAIICDLDGTLANVEHRRHFVEKTKSVLLDVDEGMEKDFRFTNVDSEVVDGKAWFDTHNQVDWQSFNEAMKDDTPNEWCAKIIHSMTIEVVDDYYDEEGKAEFECVFVTGREEKYREITEDQIEEWVSLDCGQFLLFMRPTKDYRPDVEIKKEIYEKEIKDRYDILFCIDDCQPVVDLWRSLGLVCLQCDIGV